MKKTSTMLLALATAMSAAAAGPVTVEWQTLGNEHDSEGRHYTQRLTVSGDVNFPRLGFNMIKRGMKAVNPADTIIEIIPGYFCIASPRLEKGDKKVEIDIVVNGAILTNAYAPDGFHRIFADGSTAPVDYVRHPFTEAKQWTDGKRDLMPYGPEIYDMNAARHTTWVPGVYDIAPRYKSVTLTGGTSTSDLTPVYTDIEPENPEYYKITVRNDSLTIACRPDRREAAYAPFKAKVLGLNKGRRIPNAVIENWPDYGWRGMHIDIARNFQNPETMNNVLDLMAANHLNKLHFHITDDEGWRLEIPGLPELTEVGARRGYTTDDSEFLAQTYFGDGNPNSTGTSSNGYWTRKEFIEFLKRAHRMGIDVLPEIESPGHARAAIKAMEKRHRKGDDKYRLIHDGDTSKYNSAQNYHDCVMNPALPGPYRFMDKVFDEVIKMYKDAGVPLIGIHIGGDEVPRGSWNGSDVAKKFMAERGMTTDADMHAYFVAEMAKSLQKRGLPMFGWEEIGIGHSPEVFETVYRPNVGGINCWHTTPGPANRALESGIPVILSNCNIFYFDMVNNGHPEEHGLTWAGFVDEFTALNGYPSKLATANPDSVPGKVLGVQGQIWAETVSEPAVLYRFLTPRMAALAERGWNGDPTWTEAEFNTLVGEKELPLYTAEGSPYSSHLRQPGIKVIGGMVNCNAPYSGGEIRYTTDGTEPTADSKLYTAPFAYEPGMKVRARYYRNGLSSVTTHLSR